MASKVALNSSNVTLNSSMLHVGGPRPFVGVKKSLTNIHLHGVLTQITATPLGFVDNWSFSAWAKRGATDSLIMPMIQTQSDAGGNPNNIELSFGKLPGLVGYINVTQAGGTNRQAGYYSAVASSGWHHYVSTWDGTVGGHVLYEDGVVLTRTTQLGNLDSTGIVNDDRKIYLGARKAGDRWRGHLYTLGIYNTVLSQPEVVALYNGGDGVGFQQMADSGDYVSSANLISYYELGNGVDGGDFGQDRGQDASRHCTAVGYDVSDLSDDIPDGS